MAYSHLKSRAAYSSPAHSSLTTYNLPLAMLILIAVTALWGGNFVVSKLVVTETHPVWLNVFRWSLAGVCLLPFCLRALIRDRGALRRSFWPITLMSALGVVGSNTLAYTALQSVPVSTVAIGYATTPVLIVLMLSLLNRTRPGWTIAGAALLSLVGGWFVIGGTTASCSGPTCPSWLHFACAAGAALCWSGYNVALQRFPIKAAMSSILLAQIAIAMASEIPLAMLFLDMPGNVIFEPSTLFHFVYLGVGASALAYIGWQHAAKQVGPECAGLFSNLIPLFALIFAVLLLEERLQSSEFLGAILILASLIVVHFKGRQPNHLGDLKPVRKALSPRIP